VDLITLAKIKDVVMRKNIKSTILAGLFISLLPFGVMADNLYVADSADREVRVIDTSDVYSSIIGTITDIVPTGVAVSPDGTRLYVLDHQEGSWGGDDELHVYATSTFTLISAILIGTVDTDLAVSPDGTRVYVVRFAPYTIAVVDTTTNTVVNSIPVGGTPRGIGLSPDGSRLYVSNQSSNDVAVIDTASDSIITTVPLGVNIAHGDIAVSPDGSRAYLSDNQTDQLFVIDTASNTLVDTVYIGGNPLGAAVSPDGNYAYASRGGGGGIAVVDTSTNIIVADVASGPIWQLALSPDGTLLYGGSFGSVAVIDVATNTHVRGHRNGGLRIAVGISPPAPPSSDNTVEISPIAVGRLVDQCGRHADRSDCGQNAGNINVGQLGVINLPPIAFAQGAIEFDTGSGFDSIAQANLKLAATGFGGTSQPVDFYGYVGDGVLSLSDWSVGSLTASILDAEYGRLSIDVTSFVSSLPAGASFIGFNLRSPLEGTVLDFDPSDVILEIVLLPDSDEDGIEDSLDNCPEVSNPFQSDIDLDNIGDVCDATPNGDDDLDEVDNAIDNCPVTANPSQSDIDLDAAGDLCDVCPADADDFCDIDGSAAGEATPEEGGTVETPDGQLDLEIDPGDLTDDTTISVTETVGDDPEVDLSVGANAGLGQALAFYDLEPDGLEFASPITLNVMLDVTGLNPVQRSNLDVYRLEDTDMDGIADTFVSLGAVCTLTEDPVGTFFADCAVQVDHFSSFAIVVPRDSDGDGVPDVFNGEVDFCPAEDATGFDVDNNGCIDSFSGLADIVAGLVSEGVIATQMQTNLLAKVSNAESSVSRESICPAVYELNAFKQQVAAQLGKKISIEAAALVTAYADSVIAHLESELPAGETCN